MSSTLKVYAIADIHSPSSFTMPELAEASYDLVLTLGDIEDATLDYILFKSRFIHNFGVPGNHDSPTVPGLNNLHRTTTNFRTLRIGGLGGGPRYKDEPWHFTEKQVARWMKKMPPVDIFISHTPPLATSQNEDRVHRGFEAFDAYIAKHKPRYWLHGHLSRTHQTKVGDTTVIGVAEKMPLDLRFA